MLTEAYRVIPGGFLKGWVDKECRIDELNTRQGIVSCRCGWHRRIKTVGFGFYSLADHMLDLFLAHVKEKKDSFQQDGEKPQ